MSIRVIVKSAALVEAVSKAGKKYAKQSAAVQRPGQDFDLPFQMMRPSGQPLAAGVYEIAPSSFEVSRFGDLTIGRLELTPVVESAGAGVARKTA